MSMKSRRMAVDNAIMDILQTNVPEVTWTRIFKGFQRGKGIVGSLVSDSIDFEYDTKNQLVATAKYTVIIADSDDWRSKEHCLCFCPHESRSWGGSDCLRSKILCVKE